MESKSVIMKRALQGRAGAVRVLSVRLPSFHTIEVMASSGFDFLVFDAEHAPTKPAMIHVANWEHLINCKTATLAARIV